MSGRYKDLGKYSTISESDNNLSILPKDSGITTVPLSVFEGIFQRTKSLVKNDGLVLEKTGATDGSYVVAGSANRIFGISSGKEGLLNVTEVVLIAERISANMSLRQQKNVENSSNSWSGFGFEWCRKINGKGRKQ